MVRKALLPIMLCFLLMLSGCADKGTQPDSAAETSGNSATEEAGGRNNKTQANEESKMDSRTIKITIGDTALSAALEDNESAKAFRAMMPVTIKMSGYGGFEQVGSLGKNLPRTGRPLPPPGISCFTMEIPWLCSMAPIHGHIPGSDT